MKFKCVLLLLMTISSAQAAVTEWVDFEFDSASIKIPITINGKAGYAALDSKAKVNFLSQKYIDANKSGLRQTGVTLFKDNAGERNVEVYQDVKVGIFGAEIVFGDIISTVDSDADLVLGIPFFRQNIVQIDFPKRKLRLIGRDDIDMKKLANVEMRQQVDVKSSSTKGLQSIKQNDQSGRVVKVAVNGADQWLSFDTTAAAGVLTTRETAKKFSGLTTPFTGDSSVLTARLPAAAEIYTLQLLKVGPYELEGVSLAVEVADGKRIIPIVQRQSKTGTFVERAVLPNGVFGLDVMKHFIVTFDYSNSLLSLYAE